MRLLVFDNEISILASIRAMLRAKRPEWDVRYVADSAEALNRLIHENYDVVLSDLHMPKLDGITMIRQAQAVMPNTPLVFVTGYKDRYAAAAWDLGAFAVLDKPIQVDLLITTLEAAFASRSPMTGKAF
jgi:DNA-binding NtrC family response regulator